MVKKEVLEIKRQFVPDRCAITRICGCYVDGEKEKRTELREAFLSLPEEEIFKYFDIFRKTLSGKLGKNLINMEFPTEEEKFGGKQNFLFNLRNSKLTDNKLIEKFYAQVIQSYPTVENYYIVLIHGLYDIPGKASDGSFMDDASDEVYEFILCSICPVKLSKAALSYEPNKNSIEDRIRDWVVGAPEHGFLFPAFNDRGPDIHNLLYYTKKPANIYPEFVENLLGSKIPLSSEDQKTVFDKLIHATFGDEPKYELVSGIHEDIYDKIADNEQNEQPLEFSKKDIRKIFEKHGAEHSGLLMFDKAFDEMAGDSSILAAENLTDIKKVVIKHPCVSVKVDPEYSGIVETKMIEGRKCLVIAVDDRVEINGIVVKTL